MDVPLSQPNITDAEIDEVVATLRSGWITTGIKAAQFEHDFAQYVDAPRALATSSCAVAIELCLRALHLGPRDAVFVSTMGFASTATAVERVGARLFFVDCVPGTMNIDVEAVHRSFLLARNAGYTPAVVIPTHLNGQPADMAALDTLCFEHEVTIIEDAAHALPASLPDRKIGDPRGPLGLQRLTCFSFQATKNLTTAEGGMITGPDDLLDEIVKWRLHGMNRDAFARQGLERPWDYDVIRPGLKANMPDVLAAIGIHQLARADAMHARRVEITDAYDEAFWRYDSAFHLLPRTEHDGWSRYVYPIRLNLGQLAIDRDDFLRQLWASGIHGSVYFRPIHTFSWYKSQRCYVDEDFPVAWGEYVRLASLPCHAGLQDWQVERVISVVTGIIGAAFHL